MNNEVALRDELDALQQRLEELERRFQVPSVEATVNLNIFDLFRDDPLDSTLKLSRVLNKLNQAPSLVKAGISLHASNILSATDNPDHSIITFQVVVER